MTGGRMARQQTLAAGEDIAAGAQGALGSLNTAPDVCFSAEVSPVSASLLQPTHMQVEAGKVFVFSVHENPV